ncbi:hypothetical protein GA0074692_5391 [Micromonospora pallida]|uniref:Uncharacterized protein n=1 Tax=Micromonospora pallida TaxID=145854 RepID=A0A1C6TDE1_9ACTN|nr:hypothetical protein GA0074692_5391 [Micromonospora pallida]
MPDGGTRGRVSDPGHPRRAGPSTRPSPSEEARPDRRGQENLMELARLLQPVPMFARLAEASIQVDAAPEKFSPS